MGIKMNKGFRTAACAQMLLVDKNPAIMDWKNTSLSDLIYFYEICLAKDFNNALREIEAELTNRNDVVHIVPKSLFSNLNASMFKVPFAKTISTLNKSNYGQFIGESFKFHPPSFLWYIGYLMAVSFGNTEGADLIKKTIKSFPAVNECMPAFLELASNLPDVSDRLFDLTQIIKSAKPIGESMDINDKIREMQEDIEKHDELNPLFFENNKLKTEVSKKATEVSDELLASLKEVGLEIKIKDLVITGSNASYNYTKDSDIDLHLIADLDGIEDPEGLYPIIFDAFKSAFNKKYNIDFYGVPVEVYIESSNTPVVSNGIYSILNDEWVKEPVNETIPEIDQKQLDQVLQPWKDRYDQLIASIDEKTSADEAPIDEFLTDLYDLRAKGLKGDGEYSFENLTFKEIRNLGCLDRLKELRDIVVANRLSLEEQLTEDAHNLSIEDYKDKIWSLTGHQPLMQENGIFEIYNVPEQEAHRIVALLKQQDFISQVRLSASKLDYARLGAGMRPSRIYKILGQL
jgi:predicted nucleotidyltransferase